MANMNVRYQRPNYALQTLAQQLRNTYGNPARPYEYVTGYKSATNFSGHNPDSNGIVHAVDIFVGPGNLTEAQGIGVAEALRVSKDWRASYIIHRQRICGAYNGWQWEPYGGPDGHYDHIHVSIADLYWGDPCPVPASTYDNTQAWAIGSIATLAGATITPIQEEEDMGTVEAFTPQALNQLMDFAVERQGAQGGTISLRAFLAYDDAKTIATRQAIYDAAVATITGIMNTEVERQGYPGGGTITLGAFLAWTDTNTVALAEKVGAVAEASRGIDKTTVERTIREALSGLSITLTTSQEAS